MCVVSVFLWGGSPILYLSQTSSVGTTTETQDSTTQQPLENIRNLLNLFCLFVYLRHAPQVDLRMTT